jgi:hypothetical protein
MVSGSGKEHGSQGLDVIRRGDQAREIAVSGLLMTRESLRHAGIGGLIVIGLTHVALAAPGGTPAGGGQGFGPAFSPSPRGAANPPDHAGDYDYSGPSFNFSVRKKSHAPDQKDQDQKDGDEAGEKTPPPSDDGDFWQRFRSGFGLFGK